MKYLFGSMRLSVLVSMMLMFAFCNNKTDKDGDKKDNTAKIDKQDKEAKGGGEDTTKTAESESEKGTAKKRKKPAKVTAERSFNDITRFIAGLEGEEGTTMAEYEKNPAWKTYAQSRDAQWKGMEAKLPKMRDWAGKELKAINDKKATLFYPFAGADFLHATTFFPEMDEIVMMGLEPIGNLPNFEAINKKGAIPAYFNGMNQSLISILQYSFFQTLHMANDFNKRASLDIDGTLPVLLFFIARTGHRVLKYEKIALSPEGEVISADQVKTQGAYYGTKITYQREGKTDEQKTIYYYAVNLGNNQHDMLKGLPQRTDLSKYIQSLDISVTYLKSASYLMYMDSFTVIRDMILDNSPYLLQDDSGMPLASVVGSKHKWDLIFYGVYAGPIPLFSNRWQNDMKVAYQKPEQVRPLPFGIGYQYREGSSNLMLATKK